MKTGLTQSIVMHAPPEHVFDVASTVESWADLLPHYTKVRTLSRNEDGVRLRMRARRGVIPVWWESKVRCDRTVPTIQFSHTAGFTKGMEVEWRFEAGSVDGPTTVTIIHQAETISSPVRRWVIRRFVAKAFIDPIARRTLVSFKELCEA